MLSLCKRTFLERYCFLFFFCLPFLHNLHCCITVLHVSHQNVYHLYTDSTLTTDQNLKEMRIMSLQKQLEYNKGLFTYKVLNSEAPDYISNLYTYVPSWYSNSRNYKLSLPRPRIDIFKASLWCFSMEQPTSDSQILSATQLIQVKTSCTP